jgi:hypothetical protein
VRADQEKAGLPNFYAIAPANTKKGTSSFITTKPLLVASAAPMNAPSTVANGLPLRIVLAMGLAASRISVVAIFDPIPLPSPDE